jgi:sulfur-oxidizing protein SoxX
VQDPGWRWILDRDAGNCTACHKLDDHRSPASNFGPSLQGVGRRYSAEELRQWITDARVIKPDTLMPPYGTTAQTHLPNRAAPMLSPEHITAIVNTLLQLP